MKYCLLFLAVLISVTATAPAGIITRLGAGLGLITEVGAMGDQLNPGIQGSVSVESRLGLPLEFKAGAAVQNKKKDRRTQLWMFPLSLSFINYFKGSAKKSLFVKIGPGAVIENVKTGTDMEAIGNLDPFGTLSLGMDLKLSNKTAIRSDLSYAFVYQKYMEKAKYNGHFILFTVGLGRGF